MKLPSFKLQEVLKSNPSKTKKDINIQLRKANDDFHQALAKQDYLAALTATQVAHKLAPQIINPLSDMATVYIHLNEWDKAISVAHKALKLNPNHINSLDVLSHAYGAKQDWDNSAIYGKQALILRDQKITENPDLDTAFVDRNSNNKINIIAFSLFGNNSAYIETAVLNATLIEHIYPNWHCRFYVDDSVPESVLMRLTNKYSHVIKVDNEQARLPKTMWRFLAMDDDSVAYVLFRDADSIISHREAKTVYEWIQSGKAFHTIRDAGSHTELILAGLWGAKAGVIPDITTKMYQYASENQEHRCSDQFFLRDCIWAYVRQDVYASDRIFNFGDAHPIDSMNFDYSRTHIGCDEGNSQFTISSNKLNVGDNVVWKLYSQISPYLNEDLSYNLLEERLICEYKATVKTPNILEGNIPKLYAQGINQGYSRISFEILD